MCQPGWEGVQGEWIHVYVWLSPFAVHLKLSQHCSSATPQYKTVWVLKKIFFKMYNAVYWKKYTQPKSLKTMVIALPIRNQINKGKQNTEWKKERKVTGLKTKTHFTTRWTALDLLWFLVYLKGHYFFCYIPVKGKVIVEFEFTKSLLWQHLKTSLGWQIYKF